ncbi:uncharacterized protein LOC117181185 [Belonocnema kinseyi]|uniref:uncharacterized protein LOC117181185 n=1 Tax=Belonocnema kinseyi TaxID=2817044 RepID=UPI00143DC378|nr:uncharacterized protein LOC117181185 [Belonocnema kinseyi]
MFTIFALLLFVSVTTVAESYMRPLKHPRKPDPVCGINGLNSRCGPACWNTCSNYGNEANSDACSAECGPPPCWCDAGYMMDDEAEKEVSMRRSIEDAPTSCRSTECV